MKNRFLRLICMLTALMMLVTVIPPAATAAADVLPEDVSSADHSIGVSWTRAEAGTVSVTWYAEAAGKLTVKILEDNGGEPGIVIQKKTVSIPACAHAEPMVTDLSFTLPEYFFIEADLTAGGKTYEPFTDNFYTEAVQSLLSDKPSDHDPARTVLLYGDKDSDTAGFAVLTENSRILVKGENLEPGVPCDLTRSAADLKFDETNGTLTFINAADELGSARPGDVFCYIDTDGRSLAPSFDAYIADGGKHYYSPVFFRIGSLTVDGEKVTVRPETAEAGTVDSNIFTCLKIGDENMALHEDEKSVNGGGTVPFNGTFNPPGLSDVQIDLKSNLDWQLQLVYTKTKTAIGFMMRILLQLDVQSLKFTVSAESKNNFAIPVASIPVFAVPPIVFTFDLSIPGYYYGMGSIEEKGCVVENIFARTSKKKLIEASVSGDHSFETVDYDYDGIVRIGVSLGPHVSLVELNILSFGSSWTSYIQLEIKATGMEFDEKKRYWHACETHKCMSIKLKRYLEFAWEVNFLFWSASLPLPDIPLFTADFFHSFTFNDGDRNTTCTHRAYEVTIRTVMVEGSKRTPIEGVTVTYQDVPEHYEQWSEAVSDKDGKATLYVPNGKWTFSGVFTSADGTQYFSEPSIVKVSDGVQHFEIFFRFEKLHVTYDVNGYSGTVTDMPESAETGMWSDYTIPDVTPRASGVLFSGWVTDPSHTTPDHAPGDTVQKLDHDLTLYALWRLNTGEDWVLAFLPNGGTNVPSAIVSERGESAVIPVSPVPELTDHVFLGYTEEPAQWPASAALRFYSPGDTVNDPDPDGLKSRIKLLYASFRPKDRRLTFDPNTSGKVSDMPDAMDFTPLVSFRLPGNVPTTSGLRFAGWAMSPGAGTPEYSAGGTAILPAKDTTLYAVWTLLTDNYYVFYDPNGGTGTIPAGIGIAGEPLTITDAIPVREGYTFIGWSRTEDGEAEFPPGGLYEDGTTCTLYAVWQYIPVIKCTVTYDANGGSGAPPAQFAAAGGYVKLTRKLPRWTAHTFLGWRLNETRVYQPGETVLVTQDMTLVAEWAPDYRITKGNGSSWSPEKKGGLTFTANGALVDFDHAEVDGVPLTEDECEIRSGSTVLKLKRSYLTSFDKGSHSIVFVYHDGMTPKGSFTIGNQPVPEMGDDARPLLWISVMLLSSTALCVLEKRRRKAR